MERASVEVAGEVLNDQAGAYLAAVSAMAGRHEVRASRDILSATGIKLVARGARVDDSLQRKLAGHRLSGLSLEESLMVTDGVSAETLADDVSALLARDAWLGRLVLRSGDALAMRHGPARLVLPPPCCFACR